MKSESLLVCAKVGMLPFVRLLYESESVTIQYKFPYKKTDLIDAKEKLAVFLFGFNLVIAPPHFFLRLTFAVPRFIFQMCVSRAIEVVVFVFCFNCCDLELFFKTIARFLLVLLGRRRRVICLNLVLVISIFFLNLNLFRFLIFLVRGS